MNWKSRWLEQNKDAGDSALQATLSNQLQSEGFDAYKWSGQPGRAYLDYIHSRDEVVCILSGTADVKVGDENGTGEAGDRIDVPANTYHSITVTSTEPLVVLTGMRRAS